MRFAALYPDRVDKLIYLDAHYERIESPWQAAAQSRPEFPCFVKEFGSLAQLRQCFGDYLRPGLQWSTTTWNTATQTAWPRRFAHSFSTAVDNGDADLASASRLLRQLLWPSEITVGRRTAGWCR